jgi:hypothetical protein
MPTRIQLQRTKGWQKPPDTIMVSGPSRWGNMFVVRRCSCGRKPCWGVIQKWCPWYSDLVDGFVATHDDWDSNHHTTKSSAARLAVELFETHTGPCGSYAYDARTHDQLELRGHDLACWCPLTDENGEPYPCHGDVLLKWANPEED